MDLGGSNFRVLLVQLLDGDVKMKSKIYKISQETMTGTGEQVRRPFSYLEFLLPLKGMN